jgi:flagellar basal-body rod modification protein FlgD
MLTPTVTDSTSPSAPGAQKNDLGDKEIFLKLLVAQMKFQNPLKPRDPTQMSAQLAQFNMVEQQTNTNKLLEQLVQSGSGSSSARPTSSASYLGHSITVNQNLIHYAGNGPSSFSAVLDETASQLRVSIADETGVPIRSMQLGSLAAGTHLITWDGLTDSGASAPAGDYSIDISATNAQGENVGVGIRRSGIVDAVRFTSDGVKLVVDGIAAPLSDITEIRQ